MSHADEAVAKPSQEIVHVAAELAELAEHTQSFAFRYVRMEDDSLLEVRVPGPGVPYVLTPVDRAGRPLTDSLPAGDGIPFHAGQKQGVSAPVPDLYEKLKEDIRPAVREEERALAREELEVKMRSLEAYYEERLQGEIDANVRRRGKIARFFLGP